MFSSLSTAPAGSTAISSISANNIFFIAIIIYKMWAQR